MRSFYIYIPYMAIAPCAVQLVASGHAAFTARKRGSRGSCEASPGPKCLLHTSGGVISFSKGPSGRLGFLQVLFFSFLVVLVCLL